MKKLLYLLILSVLLVLPVWASGSKEEKLQEINISYVRDPFNLPLIIMKEKGIADKVFGEKGVKVNYFEITSGAKQSEAIAAGSLHIASVINTVSVILANAGGNPVEIFSVFSKPSNVFALLNYDGKVKSVSDLKGKTVAGPKGSVLHEMLVSALRHSGMTIDDINFINMNIPNGISALLSGKVDCSLAAASSVIRAQNAGAKVIFTCEGYVEPLLVCACGKKFAENHPEMVDTFRKAMDMSKDWMLNNLDEAIETGARIQDISVEDAKKLYSWCNYQSDFSETELNAIDKDIQFMLETEMIDHSVDKMTFISENVLKK